MFQKIPKHTHLCYKMAIFNNFDYFVILPISYNFSKSPELFQSTCKSCERGRRALAPPNNSSCKSSEAVTHEINFWTRQSNFTKIDLGKYAWNSRSYLTFYSHNALRPRSA